MRNPYLGVTVGEGRGSRSQKHPEFMHENIPEEIRRRANRYIRRLHLAGRVVSLGGHWYVLDKGYSVDLIYTPPGGVSQDQAARLQHVSTYYSTLPWPDETVKTKEAFLPKEIRRRWYR
jgi:hypothetical protein